jgi:5-methylcytosine-specific restriction endonuclease McrA
MKTCKKCGAPVSGLRSYCLTCRPKRAPEPATKPVKKISRSKRIKILDTKFSLYIRQPGRCEMCGKTESLQCSHVISRTVIPLRWHPLNAIPLCYHCHMHIWHRDPLYSARWFEARYPGRYDRLIEMKNKTVGVKTNLDTVEESWN